MKHKSKGRRHESVSESFKLKRISAPDGCSSIIVLHGVQYVINEQGCTNTLVYYWMNVLDAETLSHLSNLTS